METENTDKQIGWRHYLGVFLFSMATLLLELALTRVLSVALWYHFDPFSVVADRRQLLFMPLYRASGESKREYEFHEIIGACCAE